MDAKTLAESMPHMRDADMPIGDRIKAAIQRITHGKASMRVPVEGTDPDIVLADCHILIERQAAELAALRAERDALRAIAAEAVEWIAEHSVCDADNLTAHDLSTQIAAIDAARTGGGVAQPADPVALPSGLHHMPDVKPAAPPAPQPAGRALTDDQVRAVYRQVFDSPTAPRIYGLAEKFARAIERAHGIKSEGE